MRTLLPIFRSGRVFLLGAALSLSACSDTSAFLIDMEPALGVLSGAVLATQNDGLLAYNPARRAPSPLPAFFNLMPEAWAATPTCPGVNDTDPTRAYCDGSTLVMVYANCRQTTFEKPAMWHVQMRLDFPTAGDCTNVQTNGFTPAVVSSLVGKTITKGFGRGQGGDQNSVRYVPNINEAVYMYSDYPSGWQDDRLGGVRITFNSASKRTINIDGVHAKGALHLLEEMPTDSFDLMELTLPETSATTRFIWDHTLNTLKTGDTIFEIGPDITGTPSTSVEFTNSVITGTTAPFDGDIVVSDGHVLKGAAIRVQHNISSGIAVVLVTEDLVWSDPNCCWPTSGTLRGEADRNFPSSSLTETLTFTGDGCGKISYTTITGLSELDQLYQCF